MATVKPMPKTTRPSHPARKEKMGFEEKTDKVPKEPKEPRPLSTDKTPVFTSEERDDGFYHRLSNNSQSQRAKNQRNDISQDVPKLLQYSRLLTQKEYIDIGWIHMNEKPHYVEVFFKTEWVKMPFAKYVNELEIEKLGLIARMAELRSITAQQDFQPLLKKTMRPGHETKHGTTYEMCFTVQPGCPPDAISFGMIAKSPEESFCELKKLVVETSHAILKSAFPEATAGVRARRAILDAGITIGCDENNEISSIQVNYTKPSHIDPITGQPDDIKSFGKLHFDPRDSRPRFTVLLMLAHLPENYFPGRFNITSARISCTAAPLTALVFTGTHPHFASGIGEYPKSVGTDSPLRYVPPTGIMLPNVQSGTPYTRITIVAYPKRALLDPRRQSISHNLLKPQALKTWGSERKLNEWRMRLFLRENMDSVLKLDLDAKDVCELFLWNGENGEACFPRLEIAELFFQWHGKADTEWSDLNEICKMISVGCSFPERCGGKKTFNKAAHENWTHQDYVSVFNPRIDEVPGRYKSTSTGEISRVTLVQK